MRAKTNRILRRVGFPALALGLVVAGSGCGVTMRDMPIPGTGVAGDTIAVVAEFEDATNLAQGAPVKVNGVDSGKVSDVAVDDFTAVITMTVRENAEIREGATARLRYTTPLGEIFVDVRNPADGALLADGARIELADTDTAPSVENALSAASLLINGGGLEQLQVVTRELNTILVGNEDNIVELLNNVTLFITEANRTTNAVDRVLTSLNSVSHTLTEREELFNSVIQDIRPAARLLREKTPEFVELLQEIERFSDVANETVQATRTQLLSLLSQVEPVLAELARNRNRMNTMLAEITVAGDTISQLTEGDYLPLGVDLDMTSLGLEGGLGGVLGELLGLLGLDDLAGDLARDLGTTVDNLVGGLLSGGR
jgi:phospholipid/cholesterol/gamma-HCH transport system substrate-binding protein